MKIDLHIHTKTGSDGAMTIEEVLPKRKDGISNSFRLPTMTTSSTRGEAIELAAANKLRYVTGVELNVTFAYNNKPVSLDFLGYGYDYRNPALKEKLRLIRNHREKRARQIIDNLNGEFKKENRPLFTEADLQKMQEGVDGILSRPHIADYLIKKGVVASRQEAFDKYLVRCDVPKYPLTLEEAAALVKGAGGRQNRPRPP